MTMPARLATAIRYGWRNSSHPGVIHMHRLLDSWAPKTGTVTSTVPTCPHAPSISYAGLSQGLTNILKLMDVLRSRDFPGPVHWQDDHDGAAADISLQGTSVRGSPAGPRELILPFRVHLAIPTPDLESVKQAVSKRERPRFSSSFDQKQWRARITTDEAEVRRFYFRMHLPTMAKRHADAARTEPLALALHIARQGGLFLSESSAGPVAGCLFTQRGGVFTTRLLGVDEGADEHYDNGAFKNLYHLMLQHCARSSAIQAMDLFGTEAFIAKGIFQWKRKLGAQVRPAPNHFRHKFLRLKVHRDSPGVRQFLLHNPMLIDTPTGFAPVYFTAGEQGAACEFSARMGGLNPPLHIPIDEFLSSEGAVNQYAERPRDT
ncbi:hypothetical protein ACLEJQ_08975 [Pseudomonas sp. SMV71]|uniref:hypothetical protein n=1 Tax=Pseudomonas sp. SMV71 TaxID=3390195 RepID=UPI003F83DBDB